MRCNTGGATLTLTMIVLTSGIVGVSLAQEPNGLRIGTVGALAPGPKAEVAEGSLREFIKNDTGLKAEVVRHKSWQHLADQLAEKKIQVGIFQGHEFVWAQQRRASIKPMIMAVQGQRYPVIYVIAAKSGSANGVADLRGRAIAVPEGASSLQLYAEQQALKTGQPMGTFFSKVTTPDSSEEALDDVVDDTVAAAVVDRAALDMFKRRKTGRFAKLKEVQRSAALLPPIIAYADGSLDDATRQKFQDGLVKANKSDRGQSLLGLFKLTAFEQPGSDFKAAAAETLRTFPMPKAEN